jgi:hypothetical protein
MGRRDPYGMPLERLTDPELINQNYGTACPNYLPRPEGKSIDEYPFKSTYQGAYTLGWLIGWSYKMIDEEENSLAGSEPGSFYALNRIID